MKKELGRHLSKDELTKARVFAEKLMKDALDSGVSDSIFAYAILILAHKVNEAGFHVIVPNEIKQ